MQPRRDRIPILAVDDSKDDLYLLERAFQAAGVPNPLDTARDGEQCLERLQGLLKEGKALPGLVLLDMKMPRMDGKEALCRLRESPGLETLPVILLTTSQYAQDVLDGYRLGANSVITKPFNYDDFVDLATMIKRYWIDHVELPGYLAGG